jgi:hypothetical protein
MRKARYEKSECSAGEQGGFGARARETRAKRGLAECDVYAEQKQSKVIQARRFMSRCTRTELPFSC